MVASLARPGGNLTGVGFLNVELMAKRLELLSELVPQAGAFVLLVNPTNENAERVVRDGQDAARAKGVQLTILKAATENAGDMIKSLSRQYNRARQAQITKEIAEVIGGAEALK